MGDMYQNILTDLEFYLDAEIDEWYKIARAAMADEVNVITLHALTDIRREIQRLKRLYLSKQ